MIDIYRFTNRRNEQIIPLFWATVARTSTFQVHGRNRSGLIDHRITIDRTVPRKTTGLGVRVSAVASRVATRSDKDRELETAIEINTVLQELTELNQEVLQLRFFIDLSLDEMATSMNLSLSATKMRLYRAMDAFKHIYTKKRDPEYVTL